MNSTFYSNSLCLKNNSTFLERPRLQKLLETAMNYQFVTVYAGAGYGKTRTVYSFLQNYDAHVTWLRMTERDNVPTRFWEGFVHMVSLSCPESGERFTEIGFPESDKAFSRFEALMHESYSNPGKHIMVFDDFHLLQNPVVHTFLAKAFSLLSHSATIVLISRTMPEIHMTDMTMYERVFTIREDALCYTEDEIAKYFSFLGLSVTRQDIRDIFDDTHGWTFAINLLGRSMCKGTCYERYALEAMKANIFKLIETEIVRGISEPLWHFLLKISLIDNHNASLIRALADDESLIKEMEFLNSSIRYDYFLGVYMIHNLFLDYLHQYQYRLLDEEKRETYHIAGMWCEDNNYMTDAITYYEKAGDWDAIFRIVYNFPYQTSPDLARYTLELFSRIPEDVASENPLFPALILKMKISLGLIEEASAMAEQYAREYEKRPETPGRNRALAEIYGTWALLRTFICPYTDVYDFDAYCEKQRTYYDKNPYAAHGPVTNLSIGSYALLIGSNRVGAPEDYIDALSRTIPNLSYMLNGCLYGFDDLARGELLYLRREFNSAELSLKTALDKARRKKQYDIQNRAMLYLMQIAFSHGDSKNANAYLQQIESLLNIKEYATRYESFDIARSHYHLAHNQPEDIPDWLKGSFSPYAHPAFLENYANRIRAQYHYQVGHYNELLAFLEIVRDTQTILVGKIVFSILEALTLYQLKRKDEAIAALTEAYMFAAPSRIIVPFTQYAKDMRTLTAAALRDDNCTIPADWLENVNRKASAYARRKSQLISESRFDNNTGDEIYLTKREIEILKDLSHGLSRTEIAASQNISVNTVKMNINIIYEKLHANNLVNAVRIAADRKII